MSVSSKRTAICSEVNSKTFQKDTTVTNSAKRYEAACFIKYVDDKPIAFAQCRLRHDYVEGTRSSPVGCLEGIFVADGYRKKGYAAELLSECEKWAKEKGCTEFAGDRELDNIDSLLFHRALGFEEANRIICFRKGL